MTDVLISIKSRWSIIFFVLFCFFLFFKQKTAYEMLSSLVGSEMCIRDRDLDPWMIAWSPDGESLAVIADDELYTGGVLYELDIKTGKRTALFKLEEPSMIAQLSW